MTNYNREQRMNNKELVLGYQEVTQLVEGTQCAKEMEILYAVTADGRIFRSNEHVANINFDQPDRTWERVYDMPREPRVYFIGNYPFPKNVTKWS